jgi:cyclic-di-AMP phosphodiesterase PgpH
MALRDKLFSFFDKHQHQVYTGSLFVVAGFLLVFFLPHDIRFPYEFQKGQIWLHSDFYAPFDLPVDKLPEELEQERTLIKAQSNPVFLRIPDTELQLASAFKSQLHASRLEAIADTEELAAQLHSDIEAIYENGLIELPKDWNFSKAKWIFVQQGGDIALKHPRQFHQPKDLRAIFSGWEAKVDTATWEQLVAFIKTNLHPNIRFDEVATNARLNEQLALVSPYKDLIMRGDLIAQNGNYIDTKTWDLLNAYKIAYETGKAGKSKNLLSIAGQALLIGMLLLVLFLFLTQNRPQLLEDPGNLAFILFNIVFMFGLATLIVSFNPAYIYMTPFPILPIVLRSFFDNRIALFVHMIAALIVGLLAPNSFEFITLQFATGMFSIVTISGLYKRAQIFLAAFQISLVYMVIFMGFSLIKETHTDPQTLYTLGHFVLNGLMSLFAFPLIYMFERMFGLVSDITLLELSDTNTPLLRELAEKAPGTFQHSLQVANLAESAVLAISGKPLLVRTGALYHDIGKMNNPLYYIENQTTGVNPHDELGYKESAEIIISHVKKGVQLAKVHKLPEKVIDFIRTHHGTSTVQYFYKQYLKNFPEDNTIKKQFTYPGPKPFSKETAVLMMADSVEAASRSLSKPDGETLSRLVDNIIDGQLADNQLENADITLREIALVKQVLKKKLLNIYHLRVEYPR